MVDTINLTEYIIQKIYNREDIHVQTEINENIINALDNLDIFEVVTELPQTNIKEKFYLIQNNEHELNNLYDIYIYVEDSWEKVDILDLKDSEVTIETITQILETKADKTPATDESDGLMSSEDKIKLDGMDTFVMTINYTDSTSDTFNIYYMESEEENEE